MQLQGLEAILFYVLAVMTLFMAVYVVTARLAIHSALFLIATLVNMALLFILLRAEFVAGVQILVYVGGVMVLFLFVIMLVQTRAEEQDRVRLYNKQMWFAVIVAFLLAVSFFFAMQPAQYAYRPPQSVAGLLQEMTALEWNPEPGLEFRLIRKKSAMRFTKKPRCLSR
jgi:NADH-quinone oxidoreductase subunit J